MKRCFRERKIKRQCNDFIHGQLSGSPNSVTLRFALRVHYCRRQKLRRALARSRFTHGLSIMTRQAYSTLAPISLINVP